MKAGAVYSHVDAQAATVEGRLRRTADENSKILEQFRKSDIDVLVNVRTLTEGSPADAAREGKGASMNPAIRKRVASKDTPVPPRSRQPGVDGLPGESLGRGGGPFRVRTR